MVKIDFSTLGKDKKASKEEAIITPETPTIGFGTSNTIQKHSDKGKAITPKAGSKGGGFGVPTKTPFKLESTGGKSVAGKPSVKGQSVADVPNGVGVITSTDPKAVAIQPKEEFPMTLVSDTDFIQQQPLTLEEKKIKIKQTKELIEYTAENALNEDDWWLPPNAKKKALTRSGCNKLATIFNISTETISIEVRNEMTLQGKEDIVAYAKVRATRPGGSFVTAIGIKALSEYGRGASKMKMKDLKSTAETRGFNRAIQNAIGYVPKGYSVATKEEIKGGGGFGT